MSINTVDRAGVRLIKNTRNIKKGRGEGWSLRFGLTLGQALLLRADDGGFSLVRQSSRLSLLRTRALGAMEILEPYLFLCGITVMI